MRKVYGVSSLACVALEITAVLAELPLDLQPDCESGNPTVAPIVKLAPVCVGGGMDLLKFLGKLSKGFVILLALLIDTESDCESGDSIGSLVRNPVRLLEEAGKIRDFLRGGAVSLCISAGLKNAAECPLEPSGLV